MPPENPGSLKSRALPHAWCLALFLLCASASLLALPLKTEAAIAFGNVTSNSFVTGGSHCVATVCTLVAPAVTGSNTVMLLGIGTNTGSDEIPTATYNGVNLGTPIDGGEVPGATRTFVWVVKNPGSAKNFVVTWGGANGAMIAAYYTGVAQAATYRTPTTGTGSASPASLAVTNSQTRDVIVGFFSTHDGNSAVDLNSTRVGAGQTFRAQDAYNDGESILASSDEPGTSGTVTHSWAYSTGGINWSGVAIPLISARQALLKPPNNLGLVGYWSFNEGTGTKATDFSGNGNTGTLTNEGTPGIPQWINGKRGKALVFADDGAAGDLVDVGTRASLAITQSYTVAAWLRVDSLPSASESAYAVLKARTSDGAYNYALSLDNNGEFAGGMGWIGWHDGGNCTSAKYLTTPNVGQWYFLVLTYNSTATDETLYLDGVQVAQDTSCTDPVTGSGPFYIGSPPAAGDFEWDGGIDEVRIYNRALSATEIAKLYQSGAVKVASSANLDDGSSLERGLVGLWTFDGADVTDKVYDRSGQGNNGYFYNGPTSSAKTIGKLGQALSFDGINDGVQAPSPFGTAVGAYTMSAWVNARVVDGSPSGFNMALVTTDNWLGITDDGGGTLKWGCNQNANDTRNSSPNPPEYRAGWHLLTCVYNGANSTLTAYLDGAQWIQIAADSPTVDLSDWVYISDFINNPWDGKIDDVRMYSRALSATEVKQLYKLGTVLITQ